MVKLPKLKKIEIIFIAIVIYYLPPTILFAECFVPRPLKMYGYQDRMFLDACEEGDIDTACVVFETHPLSAERRMEGLRLAIDGKQESIIGWLMSMLTSEQRLEAYHYVLANEDFNLLDIMWPLVRSSQVDETHTLAPIPTTPIPIPIPIPITIPKDTGLVQIQPETVADARDGLIAFSMESGAVSILVSLKGK